MTPGQHIKKAAKRGRPTPPNRTAGSSVRFWGLVLLCFVAAGTTWASFEFVVWNQLPAELVGKWVVAEGTQDGATFDFYRSGKMIAHLDQGGKLAEIKGTVRIEDGKIYSTTRHPATGKELTTVQTIRTLTAREFVVEDAKGNRMRMLRAD